MTNISLITPTRNRPNDLTHLLDTLMDTTANPEFIEVLFAVDKCDPVMLPLLTDYERKYAKLNIKFFVVDRSDHFSKDYYNFLSLNANGRWIMCINDDSEFITPGWDAIINADMCKAAEEYGDDILLGIVTDGMERHGQLKIRPDMSCWVMSSKEYVTLMHGLLIEEIYTWGGDYWIGRVFEFVRSGSRKVYILNVAIEHNSHHANGRRPDKQLPQPESFALFQRIERDHPCTCDDNLAKEKARLITDYLRTRHK